MTAASRTLLESSAKINYKIGGVMPVGVTLLLGSSAGGLPLMRRAARAGSVTEKKTEY